MCWRIHIGLWAAKTASLLDGDFVECGTNKGFLASAIMEYIYWNGLGKTFYLLDTFSGLALELLTEKEKVIGRIDQNKYHIDNGIFTTEIESVKENFSEWDNVIIIQGRIPDTLSLVNTERVAFLHIDLNCTVPEIAAIHYFWSRLVTGAIVLLDDYAYHGYEPQYEGMEAFATETGVKIASLPTGQGLLIKT
jgi:hypothetical protein